MSDVKRHKTWFPHPLGGDTVEYVVLASDYDALAQRCRELEAELEKAHKATNDECMDWAREYKRRKQVQKECDTLRAEVDQARRTAEYWKAEHMAGNTAIDQLRAEVERCVEIAAQNASNARALYAEVERLQRALTDAQVDVSYYAGTAEKLRTEVERMREIREIASQCAANGGYLNSQDLIELRELLQLLREIAGCAHTTGSTPAA